MNDELIILIYFTVIFNKFYRYKMDKKNQQKLKRFGTINY